MRISGRQALRTRQENRRLGGFSKQWQSGQTLAVYFPIYWVDGEADILVGKVWGHSIDPKALPLKRVFIPTNSPIDPELDAPVNVDLLAQFSRLAPLFVKGEYQAEVDKVARKKDSLGDAAYRKALEKIDKDFDVEDDRIGKNPAVGNLRLVITTEVVTVLLDENNKPKADTARLVTRDLSDHQLQKLYQIMDNPDVQLTEDLKYLEIRYTFGTTNDRKIDAKVDPIAVTPEYRISNRFPTEWATIERIVDMLPESSETIIRRNTSYRPVSEREIMTAIQTYSVMNSELLDNLSADDDIERLSKQAAMLRELSVGVSHDLVNEAIAELVSAEEAVASVTSGAGSEEGASGAPTLENLLTEEELNAARNDSSSDTSGEIGLESGLDQSII